MGLKNQESYEIFSPQWSTDSLKKVGFKSTHYALGELIDNSIQSAIEDKVNKSCEVEVIAIDKQGHLSNLIVTDDAGGMTPEILRLSLGVGRGRALEDTKKNRIGEGKTSKFGLGLKQASLSQCQRFEVYTWQNNKTYMSYLDTEEMRTGKLKLVPEPILKDIPEEFRETIKIKNSKSGTCIIWYNMHKDITWKTSAALFRNAEIELGRIYRYFIQKGSVKITLSSFEEISKGNFKEKLNIKVRKNDPLFLMKDCIVKDLWDSEEQFDEVDEEELTAKNGSIVKIKYSVSNKKFREAAVGGNKLNAFCGKNSGVSVLRNGRELQLDRTFLTQDNRDRFIGVEVHFDATLDDVMNVDGKKQSAHNFYKRDVQELINEYGLKESEFWNKLSELVSDNEELLIKISNAISKKWNTLLTQVKAYREGIQKKPGRADSPESVGTTAIANTGKKTQSDDDFKTYSEEEKIRIIKEQLEQAKEENVDEGAEEIVKKKLRFHFTDVNLPAQMLFDIQPKAGIYNIQLNKNHPAFNNFFKLIAEQDAINNSEEHSAEKGLKLLLESWARLEDEASENLKEELQNIRLEWGKLARLFFRS